MAERPSREQVDGALESADYHDEPTAASRQILAAEVRALREDLEVCRDGSGVLADTAAYMHATLARIKALPAKWRGEASNESPEPYGGWPTRDDTECADELEKALQGES